MRVGRYRHYLGSWNPAERVRVGLPWRAPSESELLELGAGDTAGHVIGELPPAALLAVTVPRKIRRELWELEWDDASGAMTPRDREAFDAYGQRVLGFLRAAGLVTGTEPRELKLVASAPGVAPGSEGNTPVTVVNVGETTCWVAVQGPKSSVSLVIPPDEACVVSGAARPWSLVVPPEAEFGLVLEIG